MDTRTTFRAGSNTLGFANYFASGTGEDNAGAETTTSGYEMCAETPVASGIMPNQTTKCWNGIMLTPFI